MKWNLMIFVSLVSMAGFPNSNAHAKNLFTSYAPIKCTAKRVVSEQTSGTGPEVSFEIRQPSDCRGAKANMEIIIDGKTYYHSGFGQACDGRCSTVLTLDAGVIGATLSTQEYFDSTFEDVKCPRWPPGKYVRPGDTVEINGEVCIHYSR